MAPGRSSTRWYVLTETPRRLRPRPSPGLYVSWQRVVDKLALGPCPISGKFPPCGAIGSRTAMYGRRCACGKSSAADVTTRESTYRGASRSLRLLGGWAPPKVIRDEVEPASLGSTGCAGAALGAERREQPTVDADAPSEPLEALERDEVGPDRERRA